jgi:PAS domain-containing protein
MGRLAAVFETLSVMPLALLAYVGARLTSEARTVAGVLGPGLVTGLALLPLAQRAHSRAEQEAARARADPERAHALNTRLAAIVRSSDDAILSTTLDGNITSASERSRP